MPSLKRTRHICDHCQKEFKHASKLKQHKADVHDIDVTWHTCDQEGCDKKFKQAGNLNRHMSSRHSAVYAARKKIQEERVRKALLGAGLGEWFQSDTMPPVGYFKREKRIDFECAGVHSATRYAKIDFVVATPTGYVLLEVDENQHRFGYDNDVSCDMRRMSQVFESVTMEFECTNVPRLYWLRYNPNAWRIDGELQKVPKSTREAGLVRWLQGIEIARPLSIGYAYYNTTGGALDVLSNPHFNQHYAALAHAVVFE